MNELDALKPLHYPSEISWWPPAPGWWLLLALVVGLTFFFLLRKKPLSMHDSAMQEWQKIHDAQDQLRTHELVSHSNRLLKRYALAQFPQAGVGGLVGEPWLAFLREHGPATMDEESARQLVEHAYSPAADELDRERMLAFTHSWLEAQKSRQQPSGSHH